MVVDASSDTTTISGGFRFVQTPVCFITGMLLEKSHKSSMSNTVHHDFGLLLKTHAQKANRLATERGNKTMLRK